MPRYQPGWLENNVLPGFRINHGQQCNIWERHPGGRIICRIEKRGRFSPPTGNFLYRLLCHPEFLCRPVAEDPFKPGKVTAGKDNKLVGQAGHQHRFWSVT